MMRTAITDNSLVIHGPKTRQLRQQMRHEPLKRFARANLALRHLPGLQSPSDLALVPRLR